MSKDKYAIYQVKGGAGTRAFRFEPLDRLKEAGLSVDRGNYDHVYTGALSDNRESLTKKLNDLYEKFNIDRPADFRGRSMSISDVVVLGIDGKLAAYYVDKGGRFTDADEFLYCPFKYYSTQRPVDIGTFPKFADEPVRIENYDCRKPVDGGVIRAWGELVYTMPLTQKQISDYELRPAPLNPDYMRQAPDQLEAQLEVIGKWENARHIPDSRRMTWFYPDFGVYMKGGQYTHEQVSERFNNVLAANARAAEKRATPKSISEQLAEAQRQVARGVDTPAKKHTKSHENR